MRHRKAGKKLNRNSSHRRAMFRNLVMALIRHERIITTLAKAKALRPIVEKLITLSKKAVGAPKEKALHYRRLVRMRLGPTSIAEVNPGTGDDADTRSILKKLFDDIGPRFAERPGGYTRVIKRHERRLGDAGKTAFIELLKEGETKIKRQQPAPAPRIEETPKTEEPAPAAPAVAETPPAEQPQPPAEEKKD